MQKLLRKALAVSSLTALGIASCAGASYAGSATLTASQTIAVDCFFDNTNYTNPGGTLAFNSSGVIAQRLTWTGTIGVNCNHSGNVQISASALDGYGYASGGGGGVLDARTLPNYKGEYLSVGGTNIWTLGDYSGSSSVILTPSATIPYELALVINANNYGQGLPNGAYGYYFTLTATPN
ncbi:MAG: hypothetical protein ACIWVG_06525 [Gloeotrichia echinulata HAB0833]